MHNLKSFSILRIHLAYDMQIIIRPVLSRTVSVRDSRTPDQVEILDSRMTFSKKKKLTVTIGDHNETEIPLFRISWFKSLAVCGREHISYIQCQNPGKEHYHGRHQLDGYNQIISDQRLDQSFVTKPPPSSPFNACLST